MTTTMPRVRQVRSSNFTPAPIRYDLVIVHRTEGGYEGSVAWLAMTAADASAHLVMKADGSEVTQLVPLSMKAWAQCAFNSAGVSLEIEGYTAQGLPPVTAQAAALIVAWLCRALNIPPVWAKGGQGRGVCCHHDLGAAGGGHHDICEVGDATWLDFMARVKAAYDAFGDGPLPAFALLGSPDPHHVELPATSVAESSHGGASRRDPAEPNAPHPTATGYPEHSVADLQAKLNAAGVIPKLDPDGVAGLLTHAAIANFQKAHGLPVDGQVGPMTWAALDKAVAK
jgi:hypothetical protein